MSGGSHRRGMVFVTDGDTIERSNLNRQFLFTADDVGNLKSTTAAAAARRISGGGGMRVKAMSERVGPDSEGIFGREWWTSLDVT